MVEILNCRSRWYSAHRQNVGEWLREFPWQLFVTLTFRITVGRECARKTYHDWIVANERLHRGPIGWIRGEEYRWSGCGMPAVPRHFHALLCSDRHLNAQCLRDQWAVLGHFGRNIDVRAYEPDNWAAHYCVKYIGEPGGDWDLSENLDLFKPEAPGNGNHRVRRRWARHQQRFAETNSQSSEAALCFATACGSRRRSLLG